MQITESELKQIIADEISEFLQSDQLDEGWLDRLKARSAGGIKDRVRSYRQGRAAKKMDYLGAEYAADDIRSSQAGVQAGIKGKEALSLMQNHSGKIVKAVEGMIQDAEKLGLLEQPEIKEQLRAIRAVRTRLQNILKALEPDPYADRPDHLRPENNPFDPAFDKAKHGDPDEYLRKVRAGRAGAEEEEEAEEAAE